MIAKGNEEPIQHTIEQQAARMQRKIIEAAHTFNPHGSPEEMERVANDIKGYTDQIKALAKAKAAGSKRETPSPRIAGSTVEQQDE